MGIGCLLYTSYELVYTAPLTPGQSQEETLDKLYEQFNLNHPADFTGHSLSVSDIVALRQNGEVSCHYAVSYTHLAFSMPAFAYSQEPVTDGTPAETSAPETGTASTDATAGKDGSSTAALTPNGNLSLVDDVETSDSSSKQFITLQSKNCLLYTSRCV